MNPFFAHAFVDELQKIGASRALRLVRKAFARGGNGEADALARRLAATGALKQTVPGSQVARLGSGFEGVATATAGQLSGEGGLAVRKQFYPTRPSSEIVHKLRAGQELRDNPHVARLLSDRVEVVGNERPTRFMHYEHVSGQHPLDLPAEARSAGRRVLQQVEDQGSPTYRMWDAQGAGNWRQTPTGPKAYDYVAVPRSEPVGTRFPKTVPEDSPTDKFLSVEEQTMGRAAAVRDTLRRLGPGSRQPRKVRGAKVTPTSR